MLHKNVLLLLRLQEVNVNALKIKNLAREMGVVHSLVILFIVLAVSITF